MSSTSTATPSVSPRSRAWPAATSTWTWTCSQYQPDSPASQIIGSRRHSGWPWPAGTGRVWTYALCVGMAVDLRRDDWTLADLARLPEDEYRYEIIDGELAVSPPATSFHQRVATELIRRWQPTAGVLTHAAGISVPTGRYRERFLVPDVLVVRHGVSSPYYAPSDVLVAVEIVSPSS